MRFFYVALFAIATECAAAQQLAQLPVWTNNREQSNQTDWLVHPVQEKATVYNSPDRRDLILYNGLVKRTFRLNPGIACTGYKNMTTGQELIRAVSPEARITINGKEYPVG